MIYRLFCVVLLNQMFILSSQAACIGVGLTCQCSISSPLLNLGAYNPFNGSPTTGTGTVTVTCSSIPLNTAIISYTVRMSVGSSGTYALRTLVNGVNTLGYNLYTNPSFTTVWGDTTGGTGQISDGYTLLLNGGPEVRNYPCYGRINALQNVPPGIYSDTITVTVTF